MRSVNGDDPSRRGSLGPASIGLVLRGLALRGLAVLLLLPGGCGRGDRQAQIERQLRCRLKALGSSDGDQLEVAVEGLGRLGPKAAPAVPRLAQMLADPTTAQELRETIMAALSQIGPEAVEAVPSLIRAVAVHPDLAPLAKVTLSSIGEAGERAVLSVLARDKDWRMRQRAAQLSTALSLSEVDSALLRALRQDRRGDVREVAARGLGEREVGAALPVLADALGDAHWGTAAAAAAALARLGSDGDKALRAAVVSDRPTTSLAAASALDVIRRPAETLLPLWLQAADDQRWSVRAALARAIGKLGPSARPAASVLTQLLTDTSIEVQEAAEDALVKVNRQ